jgi:Flp pilus assembly protein TadG
VIASAEDRERGGASLELVLLVPVLLMLLLLVVAGGRVVQARGDVDAMTRDAARAASVARSPGEATARAEAMVYERVGEGGAQCREPAVVVDTAAFRPGGLVNVAVTCQVDLAAVSALGISTTRTIEGHATEVIDERRGVRP